MLLDLLPSGRHLSATPASGPKLEEAYEHGHHVAWVQQRLGRHGGGTSWEEGEPLTARNAKHDHIPPFGNVNVPDSGTFTFPCYYKITSEVSISVTLSEHGC